METTTKLPMPPALLRFVFFFIWFICVFPVGVAQFGEPVSGFFGMIGRFIKFLLIVAISVAPPTAWIWNKKNKAKKKIAAEREQIRLEKAAESARIKLEKAIEAERILRHKKLLSEAIKIIDQHLVALIVQRNTKIKYDPYGNPDVNAWVKEIQYFIENVLKRDIENIVEIEDQLIMLVDNKVRARIEETKHIPHTYVAVDGHAFEQECLAAFKRHGWSGHKTKGSGDQGADLVLTCDKIVVVVQCKLYSNKVSNAAVQEVYTAKAVYGAQYAVVITNSGYQPSAIQAAQRTGVFLLNTGMEAELLGLITKRSQTA